MAANRQLYGIQKPQREARPKLEMLLRARRHHQYWSTDLKYIEEYLLPGPRPVYVITILENFSKMVLSSKISATQNQCDYLSVIETHFRSPQLQLWQTSKTEWHLALRQRERHKQKTRRSSPGIVQLRFP